MQLVSACLLGLHTRYDGSSSEVLGIVELARKEVLIPICPEQLGGLPTPRPRATISEGDGVLVVTGKAKVINKAGVDVTENFLRAAEEILRIARLLGIRKAVLKEESPSCGVNYTNCGWKTTPGIGITAFILRQGGIEICGEKNY